MPLLVFVWSFLYFENGEIIALNNGCGWDGVTYKNVVWSLQWNKDTPENVERGHLRIDSYRVQRIAPSVAVYVEMQIAKYLYQNIVPLFSTVPAWLDLSYQQYPLPPWFFKWFAHTPEEAVAKTVALTLDSFIAGYFVFHSFFMLLGTSVFWVLIVRHLKLSFSARWLGFILLFANVAVMKMSFYYPTLTDTSALFVSTVMLYAYIINAAWLLLLSAGIGFFTFPTAFYLAFLLFVFPRKYTVSKEVNESDAHLLPKTTQILAGVATMLVLLAAVYFVIIKEIHFPEVEPVFGFLLLLSIPLLLAQFYLTIQCLLTIFPLNGFLQSIASRQSAVQYGIRAALGVAVWGALFYFKKQIEDPTLAQPMNTDLFFGGSFSSAVAKPLLTIVAGGVYFGPVVAVLVLRFRQFVQGALELGLGYFMVIAAMLIMATIMTETRQLINFLPFLVVGVAYMLRSIDLPPISLVIVSLVALFTSKVWLPFNFPDMAVQAANIQNGIYATFPLQYYFMNHGPWMSTTSYLLQSLILLVSTSIVWWVLSSSTPQERINVEHS